jgi:hypothetical protein
MARAKHHGNGRLEESLTAMQQAQTNMLQGLANLAQNQTAQALQHTAFIGRLAQIDAEIAETKRINSERFARIEAILLEHSRILEALPEVIAALPEAIRAKFGFRPPEPQS